ncbi:MAG: DUF1269 domain-containing protein [Chloroflexaceae bacterium]|nr:DUF1269 domain-containing protein [Chloroflexaceae bacterium]
MSDVPVQVIVAAFSNTDEAGQMLQDLKQGRKEGLIGIVDAAVVVKDAAGKLKVTDSKRRSRRRKGLITGGIVGGMLGLLAGPVVLAAAAGGASGMLAGRLAGIPTNSMMKSVGESLPPNSSALIAVIEHTWVAKLEDELLLAGASVLRSALAADIATQLEANGNVIYTALDDGESTVAARVVENAEGVQVSGIGIDPDGIFVGDAVFTDEDGEDHIIEGEAEDVTDADAPEASKTS